MDLAEKLLILRKAKNLTQEQLAERLEISRQSVSKWESRQAVPELEKIVALSAVFGVTTDYLLKSSEMDDLSVKTEMLEKQQQQMLVREQRRRGRAECALYAAAIYLVFLAVCLVEQHILFDYDLLSTKPAVAAEFLLATAAVILVCVKKRSKGNP